MKFLLKCGRFEQITKMYAEEQALPDRINPVGVPEMLPGARDAMDPVHKFLRGWL